MKTKAQKSKGKVTKPKPRSASANPKGLRLNVPTKGGGSKLKSKVKKDMYGTIKVPKDREVPFGAITPAPLKQQELFITSNWRVVRPVIDHESCTRCFTCYIACPDSCWSFDEKDEKMEWNWRYCKGCQICINECPADALKAVPELDFEDGVVRLEKPF